MNTIKITVMIIGKNMIAMCNKSSSITVIVSRSRYFLQEAAMVRKQYKGEGSMKKYLLSVFVVVFAATVSFAGAFNPKDVSADAKWMMHVDVAKFQVSEFGQYIKNNPDAQKHRDQMADFRKMLNFDPQSDLSSITMYGADEQHDHAVVIVQGKFDQPKLVEVMKPLPGYAELQHGAHIICSFENKDAGRRAGRRPGMHKQRASAAAAEPVAEGRAKVNVCFIDAGKVIMGGDLEAVKKAVTVCEGRATAMDESAVKGSAGEGSWVYMKGRGELGQMKQINPRSKCFSQMEALEVMVGEDSGSLKAKAVLTAKTPETALQMQSVVQGFVALAVINAQDAPEMAKLAQSVKTSVDGNNTEVSVAVPVKDLIAIVGNMLKKGVSMPGAHGVPHGESSPAADANAEQL